MCSLEVICDLNPFNGSCGAGPVGMVVVNGVKGSFQTLFLSIPSSHTPFPLLPFPQVFAGVGTGGHGNLH